MVGFKYATSLSSTGYSGKTLETVKRKITNMMVILTRTFYILIGGSTAIKTSVNIFTVTEDINLEEKS